MDDTLPEDTSWTKLLIHVSSSIDDKLQEVHGEPLDLASICTEICRLCWERSEEDLKAVKAQLHDANLNFSKQLTVLKSRNSRGKLAYDVDNIDFYDPYKYLDGPTRQIVNAIVDEKLARVSVVKPCRDACTQVQNTRNSGVTDVDDIGAANTTLRACQMALEKALRDMEQCVAEHAGERDKLACELAEAMDSQFALETRAAGLTSELAELKELKLAFEKQKLALEEQAAELDAAQRQLGEVRRSCAGEVSALRQSLERRAEDAERRAEDAEAAHSELLRLCSKQSSTASVQTSLQGKQIGEQSEENVRLKTMLEEMKLKLQQLAQELAKGRDAAELLALFSQIGLQPMIKAKTCFQRLYEDANNRLARLENLRRRHGGKEPTSVQRSPIPTRRDLEQALQTSDIVEAVQVEEIRQSHSVQQRPAQEERRLGSKPWVLQFPEANAPPKFEVPCQALARHGLVPETLAKYGNVPEVNPEAAPLSFVTAKPKIKQARKVSVGGNLPQWPEMCGKAIAS